MTKDVYPQRGGTQKGLTRLRTIALCFSFQKVALHPVVWLLLKHCCVRCSRVLDNNGSYEGVKNKKMGGFNGEFCYECLESEFQQWQLQQQQQDE